MEEEKQSLKEYMNEFCVPNGVIPHALKFGVVDGYGKEHRNLSLAWKLGHWCLTDDQSIFTLSKYKQSWNLINKPKTYAEIKCNDIEDCSKCPIRHLDCRFFRCGDTLQEILDRMKLDDEEREFYQKRIDREYKED